MSTDRDGKFVFFFTKSAVCRNQLYTRVLRMKLIAKIEPDSSPALPIRAFLRTVLGEPASTRTIRTNQNSMFLSLI